MTSLAEMTETITMMEKSFMMVLMLELRVGHQIPLWVISILTLVRLYPQSGMRDLVAESPLNILVRKENNFCSSSSRKSDILFHFQTQ